MLQIRNFFNATREKDDKKSSALIPPKKMNNENNNEQLDDSNIEEIDLDNDEHKDDDPIFSHQESIPPFTPKKHSGIFGASCNLVNSIVGAGIIGIPYAMRQSGLIAGVILLLFVSYLTDKSLRMIVETAKFNPQLRRANVTTFEDLMSLPFGRAGVIFILFNMFVMAYGAMVAYLLIIKDTVPTILGLGHGMEGGIEREIIVILTSLFIMVPLSMQRDMASLSFTSLLSITADVILMGFIAYYAPVSQSVDAMGGLSSFLAKDSINPTLFIGLGILSTAMACQHSCFIVYGSLENGTRTRWAIVTGGSIFLSAFLCVLLGVAGYMGFMEDTQGDVLNNFDADSAVANTARALLAITMFFTYPMESFVGRHVLVALIHGGDMDGDTSSTSHQGCLDRCMLNRRERMTLVLYIMTLIPALIFDDLGPVLSITGSLGGSCISYIAPGMVYLGVNGDAFLAWAYEKLGKQRTAGSTNSEDEVIDLPVAGDGNNMLQLQTPPRQSRDDDLELPVEGNQIDIVTYPEGCKPLWWYLMGYPIWCSIASWGSNGMKRRISEIELSTTEQEMNNFREFQSPSNDGRQEHDAAQEEIKQEIVPPTGGDFCMAMFFITFGAVAAIAGLASNVYVQLNEAGMMA